VQSSGSWDPAAILLAGPTQVRDLFVEGRRIVAESRIVSFDLRKALVRQGQLVERLMD